jgi:hypothetical protein
MLALSDLWLPILLSAVFVFIASSVIHMVIPIHKSDYSKLPGEAAILEAMRGQGLKRGGYMFPCAGSLKEMTSPEMIAKLNEGPVGFMTVYPNGPMPMGKSLTQWFLFSIVISIFAAYVGTFCLARGADYMVVFRLTGTIAFLGYGVSNVTDSIWKGVSWGVTFKFVIDGLVYGLVTAGAFGWLWPAAV